MLPPDGSGNVRVFFVVLVAASRLLTARHDEWLWLAAERERERERERKRERGRGREKERERE